MNSFATKGNPLFDIPILQRHSEAVKGQIARILGILLMSRSRGTKSLFEMAKESPFGYVVGSMIVQHLLVPEKGFEPFPFDLRAAWITR